MLLVKAGGQTEVAQLDMALLVSDGASVRCVSLEVFESLVHQYVVRLDVSAPKPDLADRVNCNTRRVPMNVAEFMHGVDSKRAFSHVEP